MGLRSKIKNALTRLSGDYSSEAPAAQETYKKPGKPVEDAEVVMARLNRPSAAKVKQSERDD